jgi:LacI family kdg operon repressor
LKENSNKITINDVAKIANVSKTTISRYLNGKFEYMSTESRDKIQQIIKELNYRPNNLARSLKSNKSKLIGIIVEDITNPFYSILIKGIGDSCKEYGYNFVMANIDNDSVLEREYILSLLDHRVEGFIIQSTCENNDFLIEMSHRGIPIIMVDRVIKPLLFDTLTTNDYQITYNAMQHLLDSGFQKIGFFTQKIRNISTRIIRSQAYTDACKQMFNQEPQIYIIDGDLDSTADSIKNFLEANKKQRKAVFTTNGLAMLNVLKAVNVLGLRIPQDLGICGYEELSWTGLIGPGITAIFQPSYELGQKCVDRLMKRINQRKRNTKPRVIELPCQLIIRGSTRLL